MNLCILIPAIVGLLSGVLGYLLGRMFGTKTDDNSLSIQADLDRCRANTQTLNSKISGLESDLAVSKRATTNNVQNFVTADLPYDDAAAFAILGKKWKQDDLKIVEGIGPKIAELYNNAGVFTWKQLSETAVEKSQTILDGGGDAYKIHNPSTWAKQAEMAYNGQWTALKEYQDALDGGK